jgi:hypothetical protein
MNIGPRGLSGGGCRETRTVKRKGVYHEVSGALMRALSVAEACREFAADATAIGKLAKPMASTMHRSADQAARQIRDALDRLTPPAIPADLLKCLMDAIVDLETLGELALLAVSYELTAKNAVHLAHGLRYSADRTVETLHRANRLLRDAAGGAVGGGGV